MGSKDVLTVLMAKLKILFMGQWYGSNCATFLLWPHHHLTWIQAQSLFGKNNTPGIAYQANEGLHFSFKIALSICEEKQICCNICQL